MSIHRPAAPFTGAAVFLAALCSGAAADFFPASAARSDAPPSARVGAVRRIQNVCFAARPPSLLKSLTGHDAVPAEVRDDPARQMKAFVDVDRREKGLFYPTSLDDVLDAFESEVRPGMRLLDLGSGDGRVVFLSALLGADATGVEWEESLHRIALESRDRLADLVPKRRARLVVKVYIRPGRGSLP